MVLFRPRLAVALALLVVVPVALLAWLAAQSAGGEQARLRQRFEQVSRERLEALRSAIAESVATEERRLAELLARPALDDHAAWRAIPPSQPLISAVFVLDDAGKPVHPPPGALSTDEARFMLRTEGIWKNIGRRTAPESAPASDAGWHVFFYGEGPRFIYWQRRGKSLVGAEVAGTALLARIVAKLPAGGAAGDECHWRTVWRDASDRIVHQHGRWGGDDLSPAARPVATLTPPAPFAGWPLAAYGDDFVAAGSAAWQTQIMAGLAAVTLLLAAVAFWLYRESTREMRTASQRITFVNLVSHELKTPLTNIGLYAELAAARLDGTDERTRECLDVVIAESARLGRLITNVLTFSRHQKGALKPRSVTLDLAEAAAEALRIAGPGLAEKGIVSTLDRAATPSVSADPDMVQQILANLLSNVEKYAASGGRVTVSVGADARSGRLTVQDAGPGIPAPLADRVFEPFFRVSDRLTDGVAGTGIGLTLARDLARAMGGDVVLETSPDNGCRFSLSLPLA